MRLRLGRPDLSRHSDLFAVPEAGQGLSVTFLGVSTLLLDDGTSALMTDGYLTRPGLARVAVGRVAPDRPRVEAALRRAAVRELEGVLPVHTHVDHALDSALVAELTDAPVVGGGSAAHVARGHGLPEEQVRVVSSGDTLTLGAYEVTWVESDHCPPDRYPGEITADVVPPVRVSAYRCGEAWSLVVRHASGRTALVQGSAGFVPGALEGRRAEVAYLGVGQLGVQDEEYLRRYWAETVETVGARCVVLVHWDDFFSSLDRPLRALPYAADDLDATLALLRRLAAEQDVALRMPTVWRREDPWAVLG